MADNKTNAGGEPERNYTHDNLRLVETIKKEERFQQVYTTFSVNPNTYKPITGKPNAPQPDVANCDAELAQLQKTTAVPKERYKFPMTSAQEYGWDADKALPKGMFHAGSKKSEITAYMEEYFKHKQQQADATDTVKK
eukprot:m.104245 g.104245  ORF g.104245 m.104245 type:complete len:138 (-) comp10516_c0_seq1:1445-1858(-)